MRRRYKANAAASAPSATDLASDGYPSEGDSSSGIQATVPGPYWFHLVTEAIVSVIEYATLTPDDAATQFLDALKALLALRAPLASPEFTGAPKAPTPSEGDNSTKIATTAFVATHAPGYMIGEEKALAYVPDPLPSGWLEENGAEISRTVYSDLFGKIGTTYGAGDGTTTFNLPDQRRRTNIGRGGVSDSGPGTGVGDTGGAETHTLAADEMPAHQHGDGTLAADSSGGHSHSSGSLGTNTAGSHTHTVTHRLRGGSGTTPKFLTPHTESSNFDETSRDTDSDGDHSHSVSGSTGSVADHTHGISGDTAEAGGGQTHNNMQPSIVKFFMIFTGVS